MHATSPHNNKHSARALVRRSLGNTSAASRRAPLEHTAVRWSWLHATAYSSVLVVCVAYVYNEASAFFKQRDESQRASAASQMHELPSSISNSVSPIVSVSVSTTMLMRYALVAAVLGTWFLGLVVLRQLRLHAPLKRITSHVGNAATKLLRLRERGRAFALAPSLCARKQQRRHSWGYYGVDRDVDELDTLVVTSLSPERNVLLPSTKSRRNSTQTEPATSRQSIKSINGAQIVLSPRSGARGGRHPSNQIVSDDPFVSRFHFQIQYDPLEKEYFLQDLGSTTGTFVFLTPHVPRRLYVTNRVRLGATEFEVVAIATNVATGTPFLRVCFTDGPLAGVAQTIGRTAVTLGRRSSNALCITDDSSISGRHSVLAHLGDGFYITDLASTNGTAVRLSASGEKSARRYLRHGDVFGLGSNRFLVEYSHQLDAQRGVDAAPVHPTIE